jgi:hypothetical protein
LAAKKKPRRAKARKPAKPARRAPRITAAAAAPTVVQLRFQNPPKARQTNMAKKKLHGAALAAHNKAKRRGHRKSNPASNPKSNGRRRRRRNPAQMTFIQAFGKVAGGAAAMFGSGVLTTIASVKLSSAMATPATATAAAVPASAAWAYVPSALMALLGAGIATRYPLVGAGVAAGGAAPFILPVTARILTPATTSTTATTATPAAAPATPATVSALRAVAMGGSWRSLNSYPTPMNMSGVRMGGVSMGRQARAY